MHQSVAFSAIRRALMRLLPDLAETAETVEGRTKIANMVRDTMKSLDKRVCVSQARKRIDHAVGPQSAPSRRSTALQKGGGEISNRDALPGPADPFA